MYCFSVMLLVKSVESTLLENLAQGKVNTSWYHRPAAIPQPKKKFPHPGNVSNAKQLLEFERIIARLQNEKEVWHKVRTEYLSRHTDTMASLINQEMKKITLAHEPIDEDLSCNRDVEQEVDKTIDLVRREVIFL